MINRMACGLAALIGAMALTLGMTAGAASATETGHYPAAGWDVRQHDGTGWAPTEQSQITSSTTVDLIKPAGNGVQLLPALLIGGFVLIGVGAGICYATRRKVDPTL